MGARVQKVWREELFSKEGLEMKFKDLEFHDISETHGKDAIQAYVELENGYDVSVVRHGGSYGNREWEKAGGLYEIGVFGPHGGMCDPLGWGDDVKGWLSEEGVEKELELLKNYV